MKVWVLFREDRGKSGEVQGVYSTPKKARTARLELKKSDELAGKKWTQEDEEEYTVDEWEVE